MMAMTADQLERAADDWRTLHHTPNACENMTEYRILSMHHDLLAAVYDVGAAIVTAINQRSEKR